MTFVAAICGLPRLGPPRFGMVRLEAQGLDDATVEAHRIANRDHPTKDGFVAYGVTVSPVDDLPGPDDLVPYRIVQRSGRDESRPDRYPVGRKRRGRLPTSEDD